MRGKVRMNVNKFPGRGEAGATSERSRKTGNGRDPGKDGATTDGTADTDGEEKPDRKGG